MAQVSNRIFTIKCRQSGSATATHLATSLTVTRPVILKQIRTDVFRQNVLFYANNAFFLRTTMNQFTFPWIVMIVDDLKQFSMSL